MELRRTVYVSAVLGGGSAARVEAGIRQLAKDVRVADETRASLDRSNEVAVDVTFHVPGTLLRPEFDGVRTGRWDGVKRMLVVQVATPEAVCSDPESVVEFLNESLRAAVQLAADHVRRHRPPAVLHG